jgi:uncharacterized protein (TIGR03067 family)
LAIRSHVVIAKKEGFMQAKAIVSIVLSVLTLPALAADDAQQKKVLAELQGAWKLVGREQDGKALNLTGQPRWVIRDNKVLYGGDELAVLTLDAETTPKCIDLVFTNPKRTYEGIVAVEDKTLRICYNRETEGAKDRPITFSTKDKSDWRLLVFERDEAKDVDKYEGISGFVGLMIRQDQDKNEVVVVDALAGGSAKKAGLEKDDIIISIDNTKAANLQAVIQTLRQCKPGSEVMFTIKRMDQTKEIKVKVGIVPFQMD